MLKSDVMFVSLLFFACSIEVLPDSVFGIHDESVSDGGTVDVRTNGDGLQHWIPVR